MKSAKFLKFNRSKRGAALIIVLFFVVLLTSLTVVFLSRSLTARQASGGSAGEMKAAVLANSAGETIIGDLKQEIIDGSTLSVPVSGVNIYTPKTPASATKLSTMTPALVGFTPAYTAGVETDGLANLLKVSKRVLPFYNSTTNGNYTKSGIIRASAVNSVTNPSLNGRTISNTSWNSHYLVARATTGASLDSTPVANFPTPDWILVTRTPMTTAPTVANLTAASNSLRDSTPSNPNYVIGRYAYAIYNEGGLLDMNAAGHPSGLTTQQISQKGSVAMADLTQLPVSASNAASVVTQAQIDQIVGWRNHYTAQLPPGQFGSTTFNALSASTWLTNFSSYNTQGQTNSVASGPQQNGFIGVNTNILQNTIYPAPPTDQNFLSRQQLIGLIKAFNQNPNPALQISPDVLQYMSTFSRSLEQPSYTPDTNRPRIINNTLPPPLPGGPEDGYLGNNDGTGHDDDINPAFLNIRVSAPFTRWNGTKAVVGEPLVKTKFALSNLAMVAYNSWNSHLPAGFQAMSGSDPDPILDHFGLTRSDASSPWVYNHGQDSIMTLAKVAAANREPDCAELLKAAIVAGSLAKGGPGLGHSTSNNLQYQLDTTTDYQVLQIMANLIDQADADSYPTVIQINSGPGGLTKIYGTEDLPYFYRYHLFSVVDQVPSTNLRGSDTAPITHLDPTKGSTIGTTTNGSDYPPATGTIPSPTPAITTTWQPTNKFTSDATINQAKKGTVTSSGAGEVTFMYIVDLWNPHDPNTLATSSLNRPSTFRVVAETNDPTGGGVWQIGLEATPSGSGTVAPDPTHTDPVTHALAPIIGVSSLSTILPESNSGNTPPPPVVNKYNYPLSVPLTLNASNTALTFADAGGTLFREPTLLWTDKLPGSQLAYAGTVPQFGPVKEANTGKTYYGITVGRIPIQFNVNFTSTMIPPNTPPTSDGDYIVQCNSVQLKTYTPPGTFPQITFRLQYQDPSNAGHWIDYDVKYPDLHGLSSPSIIANTLNYATGSWQNPLRNSQLSAHASTFDPRTARWGVGTAANLGMNETTAGGPGNGVYLLEKAVTPYFNGDNTGNNQQMGTVNFAVYETQRARADLCNSVNYSNPGMTSDPGQNKYMRWFGGTGYSASGSSGATPPDPLDAPLEYDGLLSQNLPIISLKAKDNISTTTLYVEDPDGVARPAMGAYAYAPVVTDTLTKQDSSQDSTAVASPHRIGLPMATASLFNNPSPNNSIGTATAQSQSRPFILNRPFRSVSDMSYTFRGTPWKNIDFFTPASGDSALLDVFCVSEPPVNGLVAGKVDLNTRQVPVLKAVISGACRDELNIAQASAPNSFTLSPANSTLPPIFPAEAALLATKLVQITTATDLWRGPLSNVGDLIGHFVARMPPSPSPAVALGTDWFIYTPPKSGYPAFQQTSVVTLDGYAGLSGALDNYVRNRDSTQPVATGVYTAAAGNATTAASTPLIQRLREAGLRPLMDCGQTRVWNLLIDVVAQTGRYPKTATGLDQFVVEGQKHVWLHVAIDRFTGQVIDKQVEVVAQ